MDTRVRPATPVDRPSLDIVRQQAIEGAYGDRYDRSAVAEWIATPDSDLGSRIAADRFAVVVAETAVTQVGYAAGDRQTGRIEAIYVAPDYAERGYGTALLEAIEAEVAAQVETLAIETPAPAATFFERRGFHRTGEPTDDPIPRVRLEKAME